MICLAELRWTSQDHTSQRDRRGEVHLLFPSPRGFDSQNQTCVYSTVCVHMVRTSPNSSFQNSFHILPSIRPSAATEEDGPLTSQKKPPPPVTAARELKCHRRRLSSFFGQNKWWVSRTMIGEEGSGHRTHTHSIFGKLNSARPSSLGDAILSSGPIRSPRKSFSSFPKIIFLLAVEKPAVVPSDHLNNHTSPPTGTPHLPTH